MDSCWTIETCPRSSSRGVDFQYAHSWLEIVVAIETFTQTWLGTITAYWCCLAPTWKCVYRKNNGNWIGFISLEPFSLDDIRHTPFSSHVHSVVLTPTLSCIPTVKSRCQWKSLCITKCAKFRVAWTKLWHQRVYQSSQSKQTAASKIPLNDVWTHVKL